MASGDFLFYLNRGQYDPPSANQAITTEVNTTQLIALDDAAANNKMVLSGYMPSHYGGGNIVLTYWFVCASGTTGDVDIDSELETMVSKVASTDSFGTLVSADNNNVPGTLIYFTVAATLSTSGQKDSIAASSPFRLRVTRDSADTLSGNLLFLGVAGVEG